jgi:uncharacterized MAPEG superfamily protein
MAMEFLMLALAMGVFLVVIVIHAVAGVAQNGLPKMAGNRDGLPAPNAFVARAKRCVENHQENLILFAPLVLMAGQLDAFDAMTALGAQLFAGGRVAHAALYLLGVPWVRTLAFAVSLTGASLIALSLFNLI